MVSASGQQLPVLAPRSGPPALPPPRKIERLSAAKGEVQWEKAYPHIKRMYVDERRKLRYVMEKMEEQYNFRATPQMYKKKFAKWGFRKNIKRTNSDCPRSSKGSSSSCSSSKSGLPQAASRPCAFSSSFPFLAHNGAVSLSTLQQRPLPPLVLPCQATENATLKFLKSIHNWSLSYFEMMQAASDLEVTALAAKAPAPRQASRFVTLPTTYDAESLSSTFKLIVTLFERGELVIAGRLARKAFMLTEALLLVEGPIFVWNMLDIMYHMASRQQMQLCEMLLVYFVKLARIHYPNSHPVVQLLHNLQRLMQTSQQDLEPFQLQVLEQGWAVNADIMFDIFDPKYMALYYRIAWDSPLLKMSPEKLRLTEARMTQIADMKSSGTLLLESMATVPYNNAPCLSDPFRQNMPVDIARTRVEVIKAMHHLSTVQAPDRAARIRLLTGLLKCRVLEDVEPLNQLPSTDDSDPEELAEMRELQTKLFSLHVRILAFVTKILVEADLQPGGSIHVAVERSKTATALRKYAQDPNDPQVAFELWQLEQLLSRANRPEEAQEFWLETTVVLERYLDDIPEYLV